MKPPKPTIERVPGKTWRDASETDMLQYGGVQDWDNRELKIVAGSLQRVALSLESIAQNENYTPKYFRAMNEIDDMREMMQQQAERIKELEEELAKLKPEQPGEEEINNGG